MGCGASKAPAVEASDERPVKNDTEPPVKAPAPVSANANPPAPSATPASTKNPAGSAAASGAITGAVVYVLGNEACGKEDICSKLAVEVGGSYLSATVLLRNAVESDTEEGRKLSEMIKQGKIIPAAMTTQLLTSAMAGLPAPYLVDGFPKSLDNMSPFEERVGSCKLALLFELSDELSKQRMAAQGKQEELVQRKLRNFATQTLPIAQALESRQLLRKISAAEAESAMQEALKHLKALTMGGGSGGAGASSSGQPAGSQVAAAASGPIVFCVGGPGAGKTTVCRQLQEKYNASYYAAGDLLRDEVKKDSEAGRRIAEMIKEGKIVPTQVTIDLFKESLSSNPGPHLIEGFPRTLESLTSFEEQCGKCSALLFLDATDEAMQERCAERGKASGRTDDTAEVIARRARTFQNQSMPVVDELGRRGLLQKIDASGDADAVLALACQAFEPFAKS